MSSLPDLTDSAEYHELFGLMCTVEPVAGGPGVAVARLRAARAYQVAADELVLRSLDDAAAFTGGSSWVSWERLGVALGVSKQAASQLHKRWVSRGGVSA